MEPAKAEHPRRTLHVDRSGDVIFVAFDSPDRSLNVLSTEVMKELDTVLEQINRESARGVVFFSAKERSFIAGANIEEIEAITDTETARSLVSQGQKIFQKIADLPFPSVAAINGICLGGGLEMSLACTYRVAADDPKVSIGLPEIRLGIVPGFGGTQRLPRIISLRDSFDLILTGKRLNAGQALRKGVVDDIASPEKLLQAAEGLVSKKIKPRKRRRSWMDRLEGVRLFQNIMVNQVRKKAGNAIDHYPATELAIQCIIKATQTEIHEGLSFEADCCAKLITSDVCKNLIRVFYLSESVKKPPQDLPRVDGSQITRVGIIGAGIMGGGISHLFASRNKTVRLSDLNTPALASAMEAAGKLVASSLKRRRLSKAEGQRVLDHIHPTVGQRGFQNCDLVLEAIVEKLDIKQQLFADLETKVNRKTVFATNTSSLLVADIAAKMKDPARLAGMHFFNPVHRMPLVEIIQGPQTDDRVVARIFRLAVECGKIPIVVQDAPGFLINRLLTFYMLEAMHLYQEGHSIVEIDSAIEKFGMPMGPFELMDVVGIDIAEKVALNLAKNLSGNRLEPSPALGIMAKQGLLGKKAGKGFYLYDKGKKQSLNPDIASILSVHSNRDGQANSKERRLFWQRPIYMMLNEAGLCLAEGVVATPDEIDIGMIMGTGFPPFRGGLLRYAMAQPFESIAERFQELEAAAGERFKMQPGLRAALQGS